MSAINITQLHEVEQFLYKEARLADENEWQKWEDLWADDAIYWVPANHGDIDPEKEMSIIYDNRSRIGVRIRQFYSGKRFAAMPAIQLRRVLSNIEIEQVDGEEIIVRSNSMYFVCGEEEFVDYIFAAANTHKLRRAGDDFELFYKKVVLANAHKALPNLAFLV